MLLPFIREARVYGFRYLLTGDESYAFYVNEYYQMWIKDVEEVPSRAGRMISDLKVLLTVFWSGERIVFTHWMMSGATMTSTRFTNEVLRPLAKLSKKKISNEKEKTFRVFT
ncbi:MAG: hypothetical protein EZS28_021622 [Streblomastix strix]|uniref:Uncharacterized protein n=1 Tax=Streblomastix strix TaxID=222440 RepID=A0A5J4VJT4_9EUKA|nr:MAG: hypothetical protein EZS28_021622 [Streblomastix strix]